MGGRLTLLPCEETVGMIVFCPQAMGKEVGVLENVVADDGAQVLRAGGAGRCRLG